MINRAGGIDLVVGTGVREAIVNMRLDFMASSIQKKCKGKF